MKNVIMASMGAIFFVLFLFVLFNSTDTPTEIERTEKMSLPENSYDIENLGNGWTAFSLDSNRFMLYTETHQRCITQVK